MKILAKLLAFIKQDKYPHNLRINGRNKLPTENFSNEDNLFHGFDKNDLDEIEEIKLETIRFPDFSCNWDKFSKPEHIRYRQNGRTTDGCYSFSVETSRYKKIATPVHDPIDDKKYPNYAHVEVRELFQDEDILFEPPENRKKLKSRKLNIDYMKLKKRK